MRCNNFSKFILITGCALFFLAACKKEEKFPAEPKLEFKSLEKFQNVSGLDSIELTLAFTDGDGDIGTEDNDTVSRDVFATIFELNNGVFTPFNGATPFTFRIPYLEPQGNNSSIKGDLKLIMDYNLLQLNDTIRYEVYIMDRARHKSNTITTPEIITRVQ
jgi:hypothetical protein